MGKKKIKFLKLAAIIFSNAKLVEDTYVETYNLILCANSIL